MNTSGFVFQRSYWDALRGLDDGDRLQLYDALTAYAFTGESLPEDVSQAVALCFTLIRPTIDASLKRYEACKVNGAKGGRPRKAALPTTRNVFK